MYSFASELLNRPGGRREKAMRAVDDRFDTDVTKRSGLCKDKLSDLYRNELYDIAIELGLPVTKRTTKAELCQMLATYAEQSNLPIPTNILDTEPELRLQNELNMRRHIAMEAVDDHLKTNVDMRIGLCKEKLSDSYKNELYEIALDLDLPVTEKTTKAELCTMLATYAEEFNLHALLDAERLKYREYILQRELEKGLLQPTDQNIRLIQRFFDEMGEYMTRNEIIDFIQHNDFKSLHDVFYNISQSTHESNIDRLMNVANVSKKQASAAYKRNNNSFDDAWIELDPIGYLVFTGSRYVNSDLSVEEVKKEYQTHHGDIQATLASLMARHHINEADELNMEDLDNPITWGYEYQAEEPRGGVRDEIPAKSPLKTTTLTSDEIEKLRENQIYEEAIRGLLTPKKLSKTNEISQNGGGGFYPGQKKYLQQRIKRLKRSSNPNN